MTATLPDRQQHSSAHIWYAWNPHRFRHVAVWAT